MTNKTRAWLMQPRSPMLLALGMALAVGLCANSALAFPTTQYCLSGSTADLCKVQLDFANTVSPFISGSYGTLPGNAPFITGFIEDKNVDPTLAANQVRVEFDSATFTDSAGAFGPAGRKYVFGVGTLGLNLADTHASVSQMTWSAFTGYSNSLSTDDYCGPPQPCSPTPTAKNIDGFGSLNAVVTATPNGSPGNAKVQFVVTFTDINATTGAGLLGHLMTDMILACNSNNNDPSGCSPAGGGGTSAAAHVIENYVGPENTLVSPGNTFDAAWPNCVDTGQTGCTPVTFVPEPASLAVLGSALFGFGIVHRRRRRSAL